jgi:dihydrofolate reductase
MRRLRYSVAMSLDGYIAGPQGEADWIVIDPEIDFTALFGGFDTLVIGRRSFTAMGDTGDGSFGGPFTGMKVVVVSRTLDPQRYPGAVVVSDGLEEQITALKQQPGKDMWLFGGGELFRSLLDLGLVDAVELAVIPVLLGQGIPLLPGVARHTALTLTSHKVYEKTGTISLAYDVKRPTARPAARPSGRSRAAARRP